VELVCGLAPSLHLRRSNVTERCLLLLDFLAESVEVRFDVRFEAVPLG
jgi:hypothetical protein